MDVGERLRALRELYGLSQRELAKRTGVTNGMISQIEQNRVSPSINTLTKILDGLTISIVDFFNRDEETTHQVFFSQDQMSDVGRGAVHRLLVAAGRKHRQLSLLREIYAPGAQTGEACFSREGEEAGIVVRGQVEVTVGQETRVLSKGEAYYFDSHIPHRFRNTGTEEAEIVSANCPPVF